jgi:hypothetical protein
MLNEAKKIKVDNDTIYDVLVEEIERLGNNADLNHIDVSKVTNMSSLFNDDDGVTLKFNGDISK